MNKILRHTVAAALLCWSAVSMAQTYVLQNEYVRAGVNNITGTLDQAATPIQDYSMTTPEQAHLILHTII